IERMPGKVIPGEAVFKLYDTFGFPVDLTADVVREQGLELDMEGFEREMAAQRERARAASHFVQPDQIQIGETGRTDFVGYTDLNADVQVRALVKEDAQADHLAAGDEGIVVLDRTPFYAEGGGQVGDNGRIRVGDALFEVSDTRYLANKVIGHFGVLRLGALAVGESGRAEVAGGSRNDCARNHSATHLLHAALKQVLGDHVQQKGSLVDARRLRFDFSHFEGMTADQLSEVEQLVNREIRRNESVETRLMELEEARAAGAAALFGEKYEAKVRVVSMGDFSLELCGGTHVSRTGDIGFFKLLSEGGVASGVRRIEAVTGQGAEGYIGQQLGLLDQLAALLKSSRGELQEKVGGIVARNRDLDRQVRDLQAQLATAGSGSGAADAMREVNGINVMAVRQDGVDAKAMRATIDRCKEKIGSGVVVVGGEREGKVTLIAGVSKDLLKRCHAGKLIQEIVPLVGGRGGGKPDMAQGGGTDAGGLDKALEQVYGWVERR
ncbi:MAG: alanine--tRNA ligase-related protein, partial [Pseudomonadota bacterium]|nr:alanine--tRNA ligase-related protein [Pseudomonadota bacterium]